MIRLTLLLLAGLWITFTLAGADVERPMGSDDGDFVARSDSDPSRLNMAATAPSEARIASEVDAAVNAAIAATLNEIMVTPASAAATAPGDVRDRFVVNAGRVNLRAGPSTAETVLDQVVRGQEVRVIERTGDGWARIHVPDTGATAFIYDRFLTPRG